VSGFREQVAGFRLQVFVVRWQDSNFPGCLQLFFEFESFIFGKGEGTCYNAVLPMMKTP